MSENQQILSETVKNEKRLRLSTLITFFMFAIQFVGGILTNSLAIASDAWHLLSDLLALLLSWYAVKQTMKPANEVHTYGYHRFGSLAAFINGLSLIAISLFICYQAILRFIHPSPIHSSGMIILAALGFISTFLIVMVLRNGEDNINVKSALLHFLGDVLSYFGILVGGIVIHYTGWILIDPILSACFAIVILRNAWKITKEAGLILLESVPENLSVHSIKQRLLQEPEIQKVTDLHVWSLSNELTSLSTHLQVGSLKVEEMEELISRIEEILYKEFGIAHTTIQLQRGCKGQHYHQLSIPQIQ